MIDFQRLPVLIQEFCEATGLSRDTVRFYVKRGLLTPMIGARSAEGDSTNAPIAISGRSRPPSNRYQVFDAVQVERARLIRAAQGIGFTLAEIADLASAYEAGGLTRVQKADVLRAHLAAIDERAVRLRAVRRYLAAKLQWVEDGEQGTPPPTPAKLRQSASAVPAARRRKSAAV